MNFEAKRIALLSLFTVTFGLIGCGVDKTLKREFRQASWQTFNVEVTSYASDSEAPGLKSFWLRSSDKNKLARESSWNPTLERALLRAGFTKARLPAEAEIFISYEFNNEGAGLKDWVGTYSRKLDINAESSSNKRRIWELKATSVGTFESSDDKILGILAAAGLDYYGKNSQGSQKVKVSEENEIVREIIAAPSSKPQDTQ